MSDSDSDEAPEAVSFSGAKVAALKAQEMARHNAPKQKRKRKRRVPAALPADVLAAAAAEEEAQAAARAKEAAEAEAAANDASDDDEGRSVPTGTGAVAYQTESEGFKLVVLNKKNVKKFAGDNDAVEDEKDVVPEQVAAFDEDHFFGSRVRRARHKPKRQRRGKATGGAFNSKKKGGSSRRRR